MRLELHALASQDPVHKLLRDCCAGHEKKNDVYAANKKESRNGI